jgi:hypothetical protein
LSCTLLVNSRLCVICRVGADCTAKSSPSLDVASGFRIVDSLQECCHCNDSVVAITSINLVNDLLKSVEQLIKSCGVSVEEGKSMVISGLLHESVIL